jgi:hypothetical protein
LACNPSLRLPGEWNKPLPEPRQHNTQGEYPKAYLSRTPLYRMFLKNSSQASYNRSCADNELDINVMGI